ncbi:MAG: efflux RND transporter periplasmic adaptor subunit [Bacillota bacterium]
MKAARLIPLLLIVSFFFLPGCSGSVSGPEVVTEKVSTGSPAGSDYITGKTEALDSVTITPKVSGKVKEVLVDVGSRVSAGQVLMRLDMAELEGVLDQSRAAVRDAEAGMEKAGIDLDSARDNYERALALYNSGALAKSSFDNQYALPYETARLQAEKIAPNRLAQARAVLQTAEANYAHGIITSSISGEVTARYINPGELCSTSKPVLVVSDPAGLMVRAYVDENKVNSLKVGQKVAVKVDPVDKVLDGEVKNISNSTDSSTKGYLVKFLLSGADPLVKPGMFARVYTDGGAVKQFVVPKGALVEEGGSYHVFLYEGGRVKRAPVKVEKISDKYAVIRDGLSDGQDLVVYSSTKLEDGMPVRQR